MLANRISFFLGLVGQSINIDASCCGSATALEQAYLDMKNGRSDSAIVGGVSLALHPYLSLHMSLLGIISHTCLIYNLLIIYSIKKSKYILYK